MRLSCVLLLLTAVVTLAQPTLAATLDFEGFADGTTLTVQYPGLTFANAVIATSGGTLNAAQFPPHSGVNVVTDAGGPMSITFATPVQIVSGYFTHTTTLNLSGFNAQGQLVATATSASSNNGSMTGNGATPNEYIQLTSASGISRVTITGDLGGFSFTLDDLTYATGSPTGGLTTTAAVPLYNSYTAYTLNANNAAVQSQTITLANGVTLA